MSMSFKERLSFWEQKKNVQQVKPFPKPLPLKQKKPIATTSPVQSVNQQPTKNFSQKKLHEQPKKQINFLNNVQSLQKQKQPTNTYVSIQPKIAQNIKKQQISSQNQDKIMGVKDYINKLNNRPVPIISQNFQSCYVVKPSKKLQTPNTEIQNQKKNQPSRFLAQSMPLQPVNDTDQPKLTFKQKILLAQKALANRNGQLMLPKKPIEQPKQDHQNHEPKETQNQQKSPQTGHEKEKEQNEQSDRLFQQSMKEKTQESILLGGQINNLTLETRMTRRVKRKNEEDDFDDL